MLEKITDTVTILRLTYTIGYTKRELPAQLRGYLNLLGLYVQLNEFGGRCRLQAGGKHRSYFDAWGDLQSSSFLPAYSEGVGSWEIRKFDRQTWETRFAHLLGRSFEIADEAYWTLSYMQPDRESPLSLDYARQLTQALQRLERTGQWNGVREYWCTNCLNVIPHWRSHIEKGVCLDCGGKTQARRI